MTSVGASVLMMTGIIYLYLYVFHPIPSVFTLMALFVLSLVFGWAIDDLFGLAVGAMEP